VIRVVGVCATTSDWTRNNAAQANFKFFKVVPLIWNIEFEPGHCSRLQPP
jgi:hypothetical protein